MKTETNRARRFSERALKPIIKACRKNPSLYVTIAAAMTKKSREHFHRQEVSMWLHEDTAKRVEPRMGAGLLLLDIGNQITAPAFEAATPYKDGDVVRAPDGTVGTLTSGDKPKRKYTRKAKTDAPEPKVKRKYTKRKAK